MLAKLRTADIGHLKEWIEQASDREWPNPDGSKATALIWYISCELANRGIAPRWQGLSGGISAGGSLHADLQRRDAIYYDLYWLAQCLEHRTKNRAWQPLFNTGFSFEVAEKVAKRQARRGQKVDLLNLSLDQQYGCRYLISYDGQQKLRAANQKANKIKASQIRMASKIAQLTPTIIGVRVMKYKCSCLANRSPSSAAKFYRMMTGVTISKQSMSETMNKLP